MTFLEKAIEIEKEQGRPVNVGSIVRGNCPYEYGLEAEFKCNKVGEENCFECWNREMPNTEAKEYKPFTEKEVYEEAGYNKGLNDAWEVAKKISLLPMDCGYSSNKLKEIFGTHMVSKIFNLAPQEAIAKIKEYEDEQKLKVGDVIKLPFGIGVVTNIDGENVVFMTKSGEFGRLEGSVPKTGKKLDVVGLLEQIGE